MFKNKLVTLKEKVKTCKNLCLAAAILALFLFVFSIMSIVIASTVIQIIYLVLAIASSIVTLIACIYSLLYALTFFEQTNVSTKVLSVLNIFFIFITGFIILGRYSKIKNILDEKINMISIENGNSQQYTTFPTLNSFDNN